jgi:hypothetical protein
MRNDLAMAQGRVMRVLVACEYSGTVRDQFRALGHEAVSCDLIPSTSKGGMHIQDDVTYLLHDGWDLMIAHPPCTYLANSGNKHLYIEPDREEKAQEAARFFRMLLDAPIPKICVENPIMRHAVQRVGRKQDQLIQPYNFGHMETKATCLWLKGLPKLQPISDLKAATYALPPNKRQRMFYMSPKKKRGQDRSLTYHGIAWAMAQQWG